MKFLTLVWMAGTLALGGCAAPQNGERVASADEQSYVPLGTSIPKKGARGPEDKTLSLQQLENNRIMNNGTSNGTN